MRGGSRLSRPQRIAVAGTLLGLTVVEARGRYRLYNNFKMDQLKPNYTTALKKGFLSFCPLYVRMYTLVKTNSLYIESLQKYLTTIVNRYLQLPLPIIYDLNDQTVPKSQPQNAKPFTDLRLEIWKNEFSTLDHLHQICTRQYLTDDVIELLRNEITFWNSPKNHQCKTALINTPWNKTDALSLLRLSTTDLLQQNQTDDPTLLSASVTKLTDKIKTALVNQEKPFDQTTFHNLNVKIATLYYVKTLTLQEQNHLFIQGKWPNLPEDVKRSLTALKNMEIEIKLPQKNNTEQALVAPVFIKETYQITLEEGFCSLSFLCVRLWTLLKQQPVFAPQINSYLRVVSDYTSFISLEDIRALNKKHGFSTVGTSRDIQPIKETTERLQIHKLEHLSQFCTLSEIPKHKHKQSGNNALEYINREINFWKSPFNESFRETLVATKWNTGDAMHLLQETGITLLESTLKKPNTGEILKQRITGLKQYISEISNDTFHDDDEYARRTFNNNNVNIHLCVFLSDKSNEYQSAAFDYYKSSGTINSEYSAVQQIYDMK
jgi:hypothetical protein